MLFEIHRTGQRYSDEDASPWPSAFQTRRPRVEARGVDDPQKPPPTAAQGWYKVGTNHRVENGYLKRDMEMETVWAIEIASLEDLIALEQECGEELIIGNGTIEIYDDYRE